MPKITVAGASNVNAGPGEPGHVPAVEVSDAAPAEVAVPEQQETVVVDPSGRPSVNAPKAAWVAYTVHHGLLPADAEAMTKEALKAWTPPAEPAPDIATEMTITAEADVTRPEAAP